MKRILCISGSRADYGLLEWPVKVLREAFGVTFSRLEASNPAEAFSKADWMMRDAVYGGYDCLLILGDRWEILQAAIAAHLQRVPIAHIGGGDVTEGSYDDAMRDCISRLAKWHFVTSWGSRCELSLKFGKYPHWDVSKLHMVGNIALDYIMHGDWRGVRPYKAPYVVVSYQPETIDGTVDWPAIMQSIGKETVVFIRPNADAGSNKINEYIDELLRLDNWIVAYDRIEHAEFLNLLYHCEEFIGNSSAMLYEAPALGVKCRMIGKRQQGRIAPTGDGKASERIKEVLCRELL